VDCSATPSTRPSPAEPSTTLATAPMAHAATSSTRTKTAEVHYQLPNSGISSNTFPQPPVVRIHATSYARVSASVGFWALHAAHLLHHSLHPSMTPTWASAVPTPFPPPLLISSPQCSVTPCSERQQHSILTTIRPVPAPETSTIFLSSWSQRLHTACVATEITLTATTAESPA